MAEEPKVQDCWDGNKCWSDEHCGETGGICSNSLLWSKESKLNLTSQLNGQVQAKSLYRSRAGSQILWKKYEIWADFGFLNAVVDYYRSF